MYLNWTIKVKWQTTIYVCIWMFFCGVQWQRGSQKGIVLKVWACRLSVTGSVICPLWLTTVLEINYCKSFSKECAVELLQFSHCISFEGKLNRSNCIYMLYVYIHINAVYTCIYMNTRITCIQYACTYNNSLSPSFSVLGCFYAWDNLSTTFHIFETTHMNTKLDQ